MTVMAAIAPVTTRPGYCSEHGERLITHRQARVRWPFRDVATVCYHPDHTYADRERCRWCGGRLFGDHERLGSHEGEAKPSRIACSGRCRVALFRARARGLVR